MKINHRHYILILFAIISVAASVFCYLFLYEKTTMQASNYLSIVKQLEVEKTSVNYEQKLIDTFNKYEEDRGKIDTYVVKEDELVPFIEKIEKIGADTHSDLEISSISNGDNKIKAKVTAKGTWSSLMTALIMIENMPISLSATNVRLDTELNSVSKEPNSKEWRLSLDIEALTVK